MLRPFKSVDQGQPVSETSKCHSVNVFTAISSPADRKGEQWADVLAVRLLQCEEDFEDGQHCPRVHVVRGDVEPVSPVVNGHLRVVRAVFLRVHEEVSGGDRVQSKGAPSGPQVTGATPLRTCSSGTHTPLERKVEICNTDRKFM